MINDFSHPGRGLFVTTRWSMVLAAGAATEDALTVLCSTYWYPLYAFVRRQGYAPPDAQDLTQEFFARLLEKQWLGRIAPEKGRFRAWLLASMKHFLAKEWIHSHRLKRGGAVTFLELDEAEERYAREPAESADKLYDRRWALDLLERGLTRLEAEFATAGKAVHFKELRFALTGEKVALKEVASRLGSTEGAVKVAIHRLRERYRELIQAEIAETVESPAAVKAELEDLQNALRGV